MDRFFNFVAKKLVEAVVPDDVMKGIPDLDKIKVPLPFHFEGSLGARPSVIPEDGSSIPASGSVARRVVNLGTHHVGGKWASIAENIVKGTILGPSSITVPSNSDALRVPDPTFHWAVIVGDYYHELIGGNAQKDFSGNITVTPAYQNGHYRPQDFERKYEVGHTSLTDQQIKLYAENVIGAGGDEYDLLTNNCQHFVNRLLNKISPGHVVFKTIAPPAVNYISNTSATAAFEISPTVTVGAYTAGKTPTKTWAYPASKAVDETPTSKAKAYMKDNTPYLTVLESDGSLKAGELTGKYSKSIEQFQLHGVGESPQIKDRNLSDEVMIKTGEDPV